MSETNDRVARSVAAVHALDAARLAADAARARLREAQAALAGHEKEEADCLARLEALLGPAPGPADEMRRAVREQHDAVAPLAAKDAVASVNAAAMRVAERKLDQLEAGTLAEDEQGPPTEAPPKQRRPRAKKPDATPAPEPAHLDVTCSSTGWCYPPEPAKPFEVGRLAAWLQVRVRDGVTVSITPLDGEAEGVARRAVAEAGAGGAVVLLPVPAPRSEAQPLVPQPSAPDGELFPSAVKAPTAQGERA